MLLAFRKSPPSFSPFNVCLLCIPTPSPNTKSDPEFLIYWIHPPHMDSNFSASRLIKYGNFPMFYIVSITSTNSSTLGLFLPCHPVLITVLLVSNINRNVLWSSALAAPHCLQHFAFPCFCCVRVIKNLTVFFKAYSLQLADLVLFL